VSVSNAVFRPSTLVKKIYEYTIITKTKTKVKAKARRVKKRRVTRHKGGYGIMPRLFGSNTDRSTTYRGVLNLSTP